MTHNYRACPPRHERTGRVAQHARSRSPWVRARPERSSPGLRLRRRSARPYLAPGHEPARPGCATERARVVRASFPRRRPALHPHGTPALAAPAAPDRIPHLFDPRSLQHGSPPHRYATTRRLTSLARETKATPPHERDSPAPVVRSPALSSVSLSREHRSGTASARARPPARASSAPHSMRLHRSFRSYDLSSLRSHPRLPPTRHAHSPLRRNDSITNHQPHPNPSCHAPTPATRSSSRSSRSAHSLCTRELHCEPHAGDHCMGTVLAARATAQLTDASHWTYLYTTLPSDQQERARHARPRGSKPRTHRSDGPVVLYGALAAAYSPRIESPRSHVLHQRLSYPTARERQLGSPATTSINAFSQPRGTKLTGLRNARSADASTRPPPSPPPRRHHDSYSRSL
ncbi:hypothetical protein HEP81_08038 (plasmid) [Streptomyces griseofuscus]|uniref:Uncharacterized protein n=1 Tax=Streptomyces griseofuscus TaxID=146922 RepID=A0A7H1QD86_9ACTN|nr:hypothetical protein HEP81_08038 [Streptomyces griseofuscus]